VIIGESPGALPAVPENVGMEVLSVAPFAGWVNVTLAGTVSPWHERLPTSVKIFPACGRNSHS
jgi:hypothetical protein